MHKESGDRDGNGEDGHAASNGDKQTLVVLVEIPAPLFRQDPTHEDITQQTGDQNVEQHEDGDGIDDRPAPFGFACEGLVLVVHIFFGQNIMHPEALECLKIVTAAIHEDALLDFLIAGKGV